MTGCIGCEEAYIISGYYLAWLFSQVVAALIIVRHIKRPKNPYVKYFMWKLCPS